MKQETLTLPGYKNAFNCKKCPQSNNEKGCPVWLESVATEVTSGETRLQKGCGFQMLPMFMAGIAKATDMQAGEVSAMKQEVVDRVGKATVAYLDHNAKKNQIEG
jgi:hypothetical protein